jgi:hypothetical protein
MIRLTLLAAWLPVSAFPLEEQAVSRRQALCCPNLVRAFSEGRRILTIHNPLDRHSAK